MTDALPDLDLSCTALFLDVDGTMLDIAAVPHEVHVPPGLGDELVALLELCGGALAVISGRTIEDIDRLFHPHRFPAAGAHGAQLRARADGTIDHISRPIPEALRANFTALANTPGAFIEDKGVTLALHYRLAQHPVFGEARISALEREAEESGFTILHGKKVLELKPLGVDKGVAIRAFMAKPPFAGRQPVFAGDDRTDAHGFAVLEEFGGGGIAVGARFADAKYCAERPGDLRAWLKSLLDNSR